MAEENVATGEGVTPTEDGSQPNDPVSEQTQQPEQNAKQTSNQSQEDVVPKRDLQRLQASLDRQNQQLRDRIKELELSQVPDDQRETLSLRQTVDEQRQQLETYQRMAVLKDMEIRYGVPGDVLEAATNTQHAQQIALDWVTSNRPQGTGSRVSSAAPSQEPQHTPFVAPAQAGKSTKRDFDKEFQAALEAGDRTAYIKLVREYEESLAASS